jgi:hypothetical protein
MHINSLPVIRVVRLFGRIKSLKKIISALSASVVPVLNAFLVLLVVACICEMWRSEIVEC